MPRKKQPRKIVAPPRFKRWVPEVPGGKPKGKIELFYEEYEAIKLADYELMNHDEASIIMGVSRPTFARIYESARRKIAMAMVELKEIVSVYGNAELDESWKMCNNCHARFKQYEKESTLECPLCGKEI
jgi:predicted DNA-binding protein (UPF0251 family)